MRGAVKLLALAAAVCALVSCAQARCDRAPDGNPYPKTPSDGRFQIQISGTPESYVPGEQYTVFLRGTVNAIVQHKFKDFLLVAEQEAADPMREPHQKFSVGSFTLYGDTLTKFSERCPNSVTQTNSLPKTDIQVIWKAPASGSGCVAFRATVMEQRDLWFSDDGDLTKVLCEEITESDDIQPPVLHKCCACDEAKYEVTFEGLWSRNTHPKDFPSNGWLTRFSDVIGASHKKNYTFWNYGEEASEGLRQVAENGNTRVLESELKAKSDHIRTIIKARGISYPNVTGKTFAVFRVDNHHHLMSLVSMIDPSPDWFVGVSSLELCLRNCSWIESKVLNLYPWDAGTDEGWTYISPDQPATPRMPIRRIKSNSPNDPRSPFYDPTGQEMKPLARLYLSRQRLYEKTCDPSMDTADELEGFGTDDCRVTEWSDWSPCSATCGKGMKYRQRAYRNDASKFSCTKHLTGRAFCHGPQRRCPDHSEDILSDPMCQLSDWGEWSGCSVSCGRGYKTRDRRYQTRNATKHCSVGLSNPPLLKQTEVCFGVYRSCSEEPLDLQSENITHDCPYRRWSEWSPCSVTCGRGYKIRTRDQLRSVEYDSAETSANEENDDDYNPCEEERYKEVVSCIAEIPTCEISSSTVDEEDQNQYQNQNENQNQNHNRNYYQNQNQNHDENRNQYQNENNNRNHYQNQNHDENQNQNHNRNQYHNQNENENENTGNEQEPEQENEFDRNNCKVSHWSEWSPCSETCGKGTKYRQRTYINEESKFMCSRQLMTVAKCRGQQRHCDGHKATTEVLGGLQPGSLILDKRPYEEDSITHESTGPVVDCEVSRWSRWSNCNITAACGKGYKQKHRHIKIHRMNGGKPCPKKLLKIKRCKVPCENINKDTNRETSRGMKDDTKEDTKDNSLTATWGPPYIPNNKIDCLMSSWSPWSPCSHSCGSSSVQQRTRRILVPPSGSGQPCMHRVDTRQCNVLSCPLE